MTTFSERIAALKAGGVLLEKLAREPEGTEAARIGNWYLQDYPGAAEIERRLIDDEGYGLLLAVRRIERVRALIDELQDPQSRQFQNADAHWVEDAQRISRHYPERHELERAMRTPHQARVWAAFHLDRAPGRDHLLLVGVPPAKTARAAARREALRRLPSVLACLERDPNFPPWGVSEARQVLPLLPTRADLGSRLSRTAGAKGPRFGEVFEALVRACQLIEAVVDGTFPASLRQQARAQRISRDIPHSESFPLTSLAQEQRADWVHWLFASGGKARQGQCKPPRSALEN